MSRRPVAAVVLAAGTGSRVGADVPKQFLELAGEVLLVHAVRAFSRQADVVVVAMLADHLDAARRVLGEAGLDAVLVGGGASRGESTRLALEALTFDDAVVLVHDAARPLVTERIIADCIAVGQRGDVIATTAIAVTDSIAVTTGTDNTAIVDYVPRDRLVRIQTPQVFGLTQLRDAHAAMAGREFTDDCQVVLAHAPGTPLVVVDGDERNLKITGPHDLRLAEALLSGE